MSYCRTDVGRQLYSIANLLHNRDLTLTIGTDTVAAADAVRVLGVLFTADLSLE